MATHIAVEQMIGYMYQIRYALLLLLKSQEEETQLCIEKFDDIALLKDNTPELLFQTKHHLGKGGNLTNSSADLWRTLNAWCDSIVDGKVDINNTKFIIITTANAPQDSVASLLRDEKYSNTVRDTKKALQILINTASNSENDKHKPYYNTFISLKPEIQSKLIQNIFIFDNCDDIIETKTSIKQFIKYSSLPVYEDKIYERLEGWWFDKVLECLCSETIKIIHKMQLRMKIADIRDEYSKDNLPIDISFELTFSQDDLNANERVFIEQLKLICVAKKRINTAVRDYYRAYQQRASWVRNDLIYINELENYEKKLVDEWERNFDIMCEDLEEYGDELDEKLKQSKGRTLFNTFSDKDIRIRDKCNEPFIMRGSYHILANKLKIGWHYDFEKRLCKLLNG